MSKKMMKGAALGILLVFVLSTAVFAAPASTNVVVTGRTEMEKQTGIITPNLLAAPIYHNVTTSVTLSGKVVIDGPALVVTVTDPSGMTVAPESVVTAKIADKTFVYSVVVNPSKFKGNVAYVINARSVYINGKTAGQTHTLAIPVTQSMRVAYVKGFEAANFAWGAYDRDNNSYPFSYNLVKIWDNDERVASPVSGTLAGTEVLNIQGNDVTYDNGPALVAAMVPPVNIRSFAVSEPVWTYDTAAKTYSLAFNLTKNLSNGLVETVAVQQNGIAPLAVYTFAANDARSADYTVPYTFTAPAAPVPPKPVVSDVAITGVTSEWTGFDANGGNVKEYYTLNYKINGALFVQGMNKTFNKGTGYVDQQMVYETLFDGQAVSVAYVLPYLEPASNGDNTSNNGGKK